MREKNIAVIAVRMLALYIIVVNVLALLSYASMLGFDFAKDATFSASIISGIIGVALAFIIGIGLWYYSTSLANLIIKDLPTSSPSKKEFTLASVQTVAVSLIGLFILSSAIPDFLEVIISYIFPAANPNYTRTLDIAGNVKVKIPVITLVTIAFKLGLGFWFLLGAKGIVTAIREIWAKGKPKSRIVKG